MDKKSLINTSTTSFKGKLQFGLRFGFLSFFSYSTVRLAKIHSFKIAVLFRILQLSILGYIIGWSIIYKKGYQEFDNVGSFLSTKVKGLGFINNENKTITKTFDGKFMLNQDDKFRLFDTADYVIPPLDLNSLFIMTNFVETKQTQGLCDEDYDRVDCICTNDKNCTDKIITTNSWNGIPTGNCIKSSVNESLNVCEIASWCPVEREKNNYPNLINNVENYTIFIRNDVQFELFNKRERNILKNLTNEYIASCTYEPTHNPYCPVFTIKEIMDESVKDSYERDLMFKKGGVIKIGINWNCNYDAFSKPCVPKYTFSRLDVPFKEASSSSGFNFRFAEKFEVNGTLNRILVKAYGLRFIISVTGKAGKFNIVPLLLTIGSGLGLLSLATIISDLFLNYFIDKRKFYKALKEYDYMNKEKIIDEDNEIVIEKELKPENIKKTSQNENKILDYYDSYS